MKKGEREWEGEEEEVEVEEEVGLRGRKKRNGDNAPTITDTVTVVTVSNGDTNTSSESEPSNGDYRSIIKEEELLFSNQHSEISTIDVQNEIDIEDDQQITQNSVHYDHHQVSNGDTNTSSESEPSNGDYRSIIKEEELLFSNQHSEISTIDVQNEIDIEDDQQITQNSVHYDHHQGIWKCRYCCWTYQSGSPWIEYTQNHIPHLHMSMNVKTVNQQGPCFVSETEGAEPIHEYFVTEHTNGFSGTEDNSVQCSASERNPGKDRLDVLVKDNGLSDLSHLSTDNPSEELQKNYNSFTTTITEHAELNIVKGSYREIAELDVEKVLEKQDTHDLYCPNCNSCITRRVILRKRKHKIRSSDVDAKRNKLDEVVRSELDSISAHATNDQGRDAVNIHLDDTAPPVNDYNRDREPEIFRCLSCFSFFIPTPTGNGFKLFRMFGDRSEKGNIPNPEEAPVTNTNWFYSIFSSNKGEVSSEQESGQRADVDKDNVGTLTSSTNLNTHNGQASSVQEEPSHSQSSGVGHVNGNTTEPQEGGVDVVPTAAQGPELLGKVVANVRERVDNATKKGTDNHDENDQIFETELLGEIQNGSADGKIIDKDGAYRFEHSEHTITETKVVIHTAETSKADRDALLPVVEDSHAESNADVAYIVGISQHIITGTKVIIHSEEPFKAERDARVQDSLLQEKQIKIFKDLKDVHGERNADNDTIIVVEGQVEPTASQMAQSITSAETGTMPQTEAQIDMEDQNGIEARDVRGLEIIKSIVYGGLIESITSLGVVSSAAGADAEDTLNVLALGLANLIGGLFLICHNLWDVKNEQTQQSASNQATSVDRYQELLGRRENFCLHATVVVLSFLIFGLVPPVVYGFSFRESDNRDYKLIAVAAASLLCIFTLAIGKAYIQRPAKSYIKTVLYYVIIGFMASGVSYVIGKLIKELLEKLGLFQSSMDVAILLLEKAPTEPAWRSY